MHVWNCKCIFIPFTFQAFFPYDIVVSTSAPLHCACALSTKQQQPALQLSSLLYMVPEVSCLHGSWVDGVCKCESGYMTEFRETELYPIYCSKKQTAFVLNLRRGYEPHDFLHYFTMSVITTLIIRAIAIYYEFE